MNKETLKTVIQDILDEYGGYIEYIADDVHNEASIFCIVGPHGSPLPVDVVVPKDLENENDIKESILEHIHSVAVDFDIYMEFDHIYDPGDKIPASTIRDKLREDKNYFESI